MSDDNGVVDDNVVPLRGLITRLPIPPKRVLTGALERELEDVVVIGWSADGDMYFATSIPDGPNVMWLLELARNNLIKEVD